MRPPRSGGPRQPGRGWRISDRRASTVVAPSARILFGVRSCQHGNVDARLFGTQVRSMLGHLGGHLIRPHA
jgi:hypothetical protein